MKVPLHNPNLFCLAYCSSNKYFFEYFLYDFLTVDRLKELLPDVSQYEVDRHELPNILSLNFYIHDILQDGVSSSTRLDGQAKSLGEYIRAKEIDAPDYLLEAIGG